MINWFKKLMLGIGKQPKSAEERFLTSSFKVNDDGSIYISQQEIDCTLTRESDDSLTLDVVRVKGYKGKYVDAGESYACFKHDNITDTEIWEIEPDDMNRSVSQFLIYHFSEGFGPEHWAIELDF